MGVGGGCSHARMVSLFAGGWRRLDGDWDRIGVGVCVWEGRREGEARWREGAVEVTTEVIENCVLSRAACARTQRNRLTLTSKPNRHGQLRHAKAHLPMSARVDGYDFSTWLMRFEALRALCEGMEGCSSDCIGLEDVHLDILGDRARFIPSAVPKHMVVSMRERSTTGEGGDQFVSPRCGGMCVQQMIGQGSEATVSECASEHCAVFSIRADVLRGVPPGAVLRRSARLLDNSAGSEATYQLSEPVDHLDAFISHNWSVHRSKKWLALSLQYNLPMAWVGGLLTATILAIATACGLLPVSLVQTGFMERPEGQYCVFFSFLVFHLLLLFGPDVLPGRCVRRTRVFLDKTCIHQVDEKLKREGIRSLGGFLFYSWSFVVLYTRTYTQKVWTVFEMACFLCVHPEGRLVWLPVSLPPVVFAGSFAVWLWTLISWALRLTVVQQMIKIPPYLFYAVNAPAFLALACLLRDVAREQALSDDDLRRFCIREAICAVESDRAVVQDNVVSLMKCLKCAPGDCSREDALSTFDELVQTTMPRVIRSSTGLAGIRYEHVMTLSAGFTFLAFDASSAFTLTGSGVHPVFAMLMYKLTIPLAVFPLACALCVRLCGCWLHLNGFRNVLFITFVGVSVASCITLCGVSFRFFFARAMFVVLYLVLTCLFVLTFVVFRTPSGRQRRRRVNACQETTDDLAMALAHSRQLRHHGSLSNRAR